MNCDSNNTQTKGEPLLTLRRPCVDKEKAVKLASLLYGLDVSDASQVKEFVSYDDRNFYIKGTLPNHSNHCNGEPQTSEGEFVLKILNHVDSENISFANAQNEVLLHLNANGFACPVPARALNGEYTMQCKLDSPETCASEEQTKEQEVSRVYAVRLLTFVPGILLKDICCTSEILFSLGCYIGKMNKALQVIRKPLRLVSIGFHVIIWVPNCPGCFKIKYIRRPEGLGGGGGGGGQCGRALIKVLYGETLPRGPNPYPFINPFC